MHVTAEITTTSLPFFLPVSLLPLPWAPCDAVYIEEPRLESVPITSDVRRESAAAVMLVCCLRFDRACNCLVTLNYSTGR